MKNNQLLITHIYKTHNGQLCLIPYASWPVAAGFPSPAQDFIEHSLDLNELLIKHPAATFFMRVVGHSMKDAGILSGDMLIVDRALPVADNKVVVAVLNGEFTVKRIKRTAETIFLCAENPDYKDIGVTPEMQFEVWGVVTWVIHAV